MSMPGRSVMVAISMTPESKARGYGPAYPFFCHTPSPPLAPSPHDHTPNPFNIYWGFFLHLYKLSHSFSTNALALFLHPLQEHRPGVPPIANEMGQRLPSRRMRSLLFPLRSRRFLCRRSRPCRQVGHKADEPQGDDQVCA